MDLHELTAISPVDGRYRKTTDPLASYFSESGLIRYRLLVEVEYFITLCDTQLPGLPKPDNKQREWLRAIYEDFSVDDAILIKEKEEITNHDVKAVEYFLKEKISETKLAPYSELVHFGLTSQDINNTAIPLSLKEAANNVIFPALQKLIGLITSRAREWRDI